MDCPKCKSENAMVHISALKWMKAKKWVHLKQCQACGYETEAK